MKKLMFIYGLLIMSFIVYVINYQTSKNDDNPWETTGGLRGSIDEKYVMVTFQSGIDYWKGVLKGFEDAAEALNVSVEYRGATKYDLQEQITVLEQVIAKRPAGIALSAINPEALNPTINKAIEEGIPVVLFDSGTTESKAYSLLATDNYRAGVIAARTMADLTGGQGDVAILYQPHQMNLEERTRGFKETIRTEFPGMEVVEVVDAKAQRTTSYDATMQLVSKYPDLRGIFITEANGGVGVGDAIQSLGNEKVKIVSFDTDKGTLDMVKDGRIDATMAQGTWSMGYWSLQFLFHMKHELVQAANWQTTTMSPLPVQVDTGINVVTQQNVDEYYAK
ncbi:sugar ABC transporter substrate-binding protein [Paenibacillus sp. CCS19]|uniref:substrate-binding domain-containing protein n=1 Tax=Paenibacillus sp. CCS19 TaxID=3158387 RepID=UPI002562C9B1|nr:substrate-binding domain-containing protein [Paenibacillus cellulosilyticus]GMK39968.1 sugar ABC transporter substrate-binding protein [Paenibacillus cellulosilyticus]